MGADTILLLDFDPTRSLCARVHEILAQAVAPAIHVRLESVLACETRLRDAEVRSILSRVNPSIVFLTLPSSACDDSSELTGSLFQLLAVPTIVAMERCEPEEMLKLLDLGATDFISPPLSPLGVLPRTWRLLEQARGREHLNRSLTQKLGLKQLVGESPAFVAQVERIPLVAKTDVTVLILGETGTGKELFARAIHYLGPRSAKPFVPVNCGAIPAELIENEMFGHERGAYTSASSSKLGLVSEADGGTLFLDEIDCLPLVAQVKLLRFIQEKEYRPLGSARTHHADLRIIAASNSELRSAVTNGRMRQDLYYRINIIPFTLPPLRDRREDIQLLARRFLSKCAAELDKQFVGLSSEAIGALLAYDWPGNVRELENVIARAAVLSPGPIVLEGDIQVQPDAATSECSFREAKARTVGLFEKTYISGLLLAHAGNITRAAEAAHKNRRAFFELMRKHNIDARSFRTRS